MEYKIKFKHIRPEDIDPATAKVKPGTFCFIEHKVEPASSSPTPVTEYVVAWTGIALLHPGDNFNRAIGRRVAFERAISTIENRELRKKLWTQLAAASPKTVQAGRV